MVNCERAVRLRDLNVSDVLGDSSRRTLTRTVSQLELRQVVERAYLGVFLLTANVELAEIAVTACMDAIDIEGLMEALPLCAVRIALELQRNGWEQAASNTNLITEAIPFELDCVLQLPSFLRHTVVLRLLTGVALPICSDILQMESESICASTSVTALKLARAIAPNSALSGW